jgi:hypothetical protein
MVSHQSRFLHHLLPMMLPQTEALGMTNTTKPMTPPVPDLAASARLADARIDQTQLEDAASM